MEKPIIAMTMGDPAGIGPELIVKVLSQKDVYTICRPFVVGEPVVMRDITQFVRVNQQFNQIERLSEAKFDFSIVEVLRPQRLNMGQVTWGKVDPAMGRAAALCLETAFELAMKKEIQGVVSAPLNKEAFHLAGYDYLDELAYLAYLTQSPEPFIVGVMDSIWVVMVTEHIPFREIANSITYARVIKSIQRLYQILTKVMHDDAKIAVAALNVHGGEGGQFGREEIDEIAPAIEAARVEGINVHGPFPADTLFVRALEEGYSGIVCMYHDQANIARKLLAKRSGATFFMGLPVVCGTTAHGTAFDKAGKGISDPSSLENVMKLTIKLSPSGLE